MRWLFGFHGYLWPNNAFWLLISLATWTWLTPALAAMATLEPWWIALLLGRNLALTLLLFGGLHLYLHVFAGQGTAFKLSPRPLATDSGRFLFRHQVRDNMVRTLVFGVPVFTGYEAFTYWGFANGVLGLTGAGASPLVYWVWFAVLLLLAPLIHSVHFYFTHRLLHVPALYRAVLGVHHRNVEVGPWSGLAMHPLEHVVYFSTVVVAGGASDVSARLAIAPPGRTLAARCRRRRYRGVVGATGKHRTRADIESAIEFSVALPLRFLRAWWARLGLNQ